MKGILHTPYFYLFFYHDGLLDATGTGVRPSFTEWEKDVKSYSIVRVFISVSD